MGMVFSCRDDNGESSWDTTKYKIAGAIWYQGESNTSNYNTYSRLMAKMIGAWRSGWAIISHFISSRLPLLPTEITMLVH